MSIEEKVNQVEHLYVKLDKQIAYFQEATTLHCKFGCGKCCTKPDIEATVLEFLPFAFYLYQNNKAEIWWERLKSNDNSICLIFNENQSGAGLCTEYKHRGLICRLFGYAARTNKYGKKELVTCQIIKSEQKAQYEATTVAIENDVAVPVFNQFYMQLAAIDDDLTKQFFPINVAIQKAIEEVLHYYAYRA